MSNLIGRVHSVTRGRPAVFKETSGAVDSVFVPCQDGHVFSIASADNGEILAISDTVYSTERAARDRAGEIAPTVKDGVSELY